MDVFKTKAMLILGFFAVVFIATIISELIEKYDTNERFYKWIERVFGVGLKQSKK